MSQQTLADLFNIPLPAQMNSQDPVLVIDGDDDTRLLLIHHLQKLQYKNISSFTSAYEALNHLRSQKTNFAMTFCSMDTQMMSGSDYLEELQNDENLNRGPFIMSIENASKEKIMLAMENGVDEVIIKPYSFDDIARKIRSAFHIYHNPKNPEKIYELAKKSLCSKQLDEAEKIYSILAKHTTHAARPYVGLAKIEYFRGNYQKAFEHLKVAINRNPNFVHAFAEQGRVYLDSGDISQAIISYQQAIQLSPLNPERYEAICRMFWDLQKHEQVIEFMRRAKKNGLEFPGLYYFLSQSLFALRQYKEALPYFIEAITYDSTNLELLNNLGVCYKELKEYDKATKVYNSIIKVDPNNTETLFNKAMMLHEQNKDDEAVKLFERLLKKHPDHLIANAMMDEIKSARGVA